MYHYLISKIKLIAIKNYIICTHMAKKFQLKFSKGKDHNYLYEVRQDTTGNHSKGTITFSVVAMATYFHIITEHILDFTLKNNNWYSEKISEV